jgi:hypothetical protein
VKRVVLGIALGVAVTLAGTAAAHQDSTTLRAPRCHASPPGWVCSLPRLPRNGLGDYTINVPDADLSCLVSRFTRAPASVGCERLSKPALKCVDDTLGSLSVNITPAKMEVDTPQRCVPTSKPPYYKLTSGYRAHVFYRAP